MPNAHVQVVYSNTDSHHHLTSVSDSWADGEESVQLPAPPKPGHPRPAHQAIPGATPVAQRVVTPPRDSVMQRTWYVAGSAGHALTRLVSMGTSMVHRSFRNQVAAAPSITSSEGELSLRDQQAGTSGPGARSESALPTKRGPFTIMNVPWLGFASMHASKRNESEATASASALHVRPTQNSEVDAAPAAHCRSSSTASSGHGAQKSEAQAGPTSVGQPAVRAHAQQHYNPVYGLQERSEPCASQAGMLHAHPAGMQMAPGHSAMGQDGNCGTPGKPTALQQVSPSQQRTAAMHAQPRRTRDVSPTHQPPPAHKNQHASPRRPLPESTSKAAMVLYSDPPGSGSKPKRQNKHHAVAPLPVGQR